MEAPEVDFYFVVAANTNGTFSTYAEAPKDMVSARSANTYEMFQTMKEIVKEMENSFLADRIARTIIGALQPKQTNVADIVSEALKERKNNPENTAPTE